MIRDFHLVDAATRNLPPCPVCLAQRKGCCVTEGGVNSRRPHPEREQIALREKRSWIEAKRAAVPAREEP